MVSRASLQLWHRVSVTFVKVRCWVAGVVVQRSQVNDGSPVWVDGWGWHMMVPPLVVLGFRGL